MKVFLGVAPGMIWTIIILVLVGLAEWITTYFGVQAWAAPLVGLMAIVIAVVKVLATNEPPAGRALNGEVYVPQRSKLSRWLW